MDHKYKAFISYSRNDKRLAEWLHRRLETYKIPKEFFGQEIIDSSRKIPERIFPVFLDKEELPANADLSRSIQQALEQSDYLVVVCSRKSASSMWVDKEVAYFKNVRGADYVLCLIIDGEPNASRRKDMQNIECFCPSLRHEVDEAGNPTLEKAATEPLGADIRPGQDSRSTALLKLVSGISGIPFAQLSNREARRKYQKRLLAGSVVLLGLAIVLGTLYAQEIRNSARIKSERDRAQELAHFMIFDLSSRLEEVGRLELMASVATKVEGYYEGSNEAKLDQSALIQRAEGYGILARVYKAQGDFSRALDTLKDSQAVYQIVLRLDPSDPETPIDIIQNSLLEAKLLLDRNEHTQAQSVLEHIEGQLKKDSLPKSSWRYYETLASIYEVLGDSHAYKNNFEPALLYHRKALAANASSKKQKRDSSSDTELNESNYNYKAGLDLLFLGDKESSLDHLEKGFTQAKSLIERDPNNAQFMETYCSLTGALGRLYIELDQMPKAIKTLKESIKFAREGYELDTTNQNNKLVLSNMIVALGDAFWRDEQRDLARDQYIDSISLRSELVKREPSNKTWLTGLASSYSKLGNYHLYSGNGEDAEANYRRSLSILTKLLAQGPDLAYLQEQVRQMRENVSFAVELQKE